MSGRDDPKDKIGTAPAIGKWTERVCLAIPLLPLLILAYGFWDVFA